MSLIRPIPCRLCGREVETSETDIHGRCYDCRRDATSHRECDSALSAALDRARVAEGALAGLRSAYAILDADYKAAMALFLDRVTVDFGMSLAALVREEFARSDAARARIGALEEALREIVTTATDPMATMNNLTRLDRCYGSAARALAPEKDRA